MNEKAERDVFHLYRSVELSSEWMGVAKTQVQEWIM